MFPLVSICVPSLNARAFLEDRMRSVLEQTVSDWELIVCDSYSTDGSWQYFSRFNNDSRVRLHQVPREGLYAGWNECLKRARGKYVYIAAADDTCAPHLLERLIAPLERFPDLKVAVCDYEVIDEQGHPLNVGIGEKVRRFYGEWMNRPHVRDGRTEFILHACLGIVWRTVTAVLFRRDLLDDIGLFRTDRGSQADEEWEMRAALASNIAYVSGKLATWRVHSGQATARLGLRNRTNLACLESVLHDEQAGIPSLWRTVPRWDREITAVCRQEYLDSYKLYIENAREYPGLFARSLGLALRREPAWLWRQLKRGFAWDPACNPDPNAAASELIKRLRCMWPPTPMADYRHGGVSAT